MSKINWLKYLSIAVVIVQVVMLIAIQIEIMGVVWLVVSHIVVIVTIAVAIIRIHHILFVSSPNLVHDPIMICKSLSVITFSPLLDLRLWFSIYPLSKVSLISFLCLSLFLIPSLPKVYIALCWVWIYVTWAHHLL